MRLLAIKGCGEKMRVDATLVNQHVYGHDMPEYLVMPELGNNRFKLSKMGADGVPVYIEQENDAIDEKDIHQLEM